MLWVGKLIIFTKTKIKGERKVMASYNGVVKWFNNTKGFGFIEVKGQADIFAHYSNIRADGYRSLNEGDEVEFDTEETSKGPQAIDIIVTKHAPVKERKTGD